MELEELKKSWNALDEHLKDKEPDQRGRTWQTDRTCRQRYPCHCPAEYQTNPDFFAGIGLIPAGSPVARQTESDLYHYHSIVDSRTLLGHHHHPFSTTDESGRNASDRGDQSCQPHPPMDDSGTSDCYCFPSYTGSTLIYLLADMAIWDSHHSIFYPALGSWPGADLVDLSQEIPEPYSGNQEEPGRT